MFKLLTPKHSPTVYGSATPHTTHLSSMDLSTVLCNPKYTTGTLLIKESIPIIQQPVPRKRHF
jgi:hypothetical protein